MGKAAKVMHVGGVDHELLHNIVQATDSGSFIYASKTAFHPMLSHTPPLVEVNDAMIDPTDSTRYAVRATAHATSHLAEVAAKQATPAPAATTYALITNAVLPEPKKRGNSFGSGAPTKYPFADMPVGASFFSPNSDHTKGDAVKGLGSTVSAQNKKYSEGVVENGQPKMKVVTRAVRGEDHKAKLDEHGKKITETVTLPVLTYHRKFTIRPVVGGQTYGGWTAPTDGALIARTL